MFNGFNSGTTAAGQCYCNKPWWGIVPPPPCDYNACIMTRHARTLAGAPGPHAFPGPRLQGWECPRCKAINAPTQATCARCTPTENAVEDDDGPEDEIHRKRR